MNRIIFAVLVLAVVICLFFARDNGILGSLNVIEADIAKDTKSLDIADNLRIPSFFIGGPYFIHNEKQKIIVFRDDDIGPYWSVDSAIYVTEVFRERNVSHVVAVVPGSKSGYTLSDDAQLTDYLVSIKDDESIEFALHGYDHSFFEFEDVPLEGSRDSAMSKMSSGVKIMDDVLGTLPVTFVPPYGVHNENTLIALRRMPSLNIFSSMHGGKHDKTAFKKIDGVFYLPGTTDFYNWREERDNSAGDIKGSCERAMDEYNVCVIVLHHHMFVDYWGDMDEKKLQVLFDVIEWAKSKERDGKARIVLLKDITEGDLS